MNSTKYAAGNIIQCNQRAYAGAKERREKVLTILKSKYPSLDFAITNQIDYWKKLMCL